MGGKLIHLNKYKISNKTLKKRLVNSADYSYNSLSDKNASHTKIENNISYEALISFIIDYGIKVQESDLKMYTTLMCKYHKRIIFYGVKYYLPCYKFNEEEYRIYDILIKYYLVD